jgi:hypothetical protein
MRALAAIGIGVVLAGGLLGAAQAKPKPKAPDADALGLAVGGETATKALLDDEHQLLLVQLGEAAPDWAGMRDRVKTAQQSLDADGSLPGWGVALMWSTDRMAISQVIDGRTETEVGDGYTMLLDKAEYVLAASPVAVQAHEIWDYGSGYTAGKKVTCKGTATNLSSEPAEVTVRCSIYGEVENATAVWTHVGTENEKAETRQVVLGTVDKSLGKLKPGKKAKYSFKVTLGDLSSDASLLDFCGIDCKVDSMSFDTQYLVDGKATSHFDDAKDKEGKAWLKLLGTLADAGLRLSVTGTWDPHAGYQTFTVGEPFASLDDKARAKQAKKLWKALKAHLKKYAKASYFAVYLVDEQGTSVGSIQDGGRYSTSMY